MQGSVIFSQPFDRQDVLVAYRVRENRTRIMRHVTEQDRAGAAFGAIAAQFRSGESEFVAQRPRQRLLFHDIHAAALSIDVQTDEPFARTSGPMNR